MKVTLYQIPWEYGCTSQWINYRFYASRIAANHAIQDKEIQEAFGLPNNGVLPNEVEIDVSPVMLADFLNETIHVSGQMDRFEE